MRSAAIIGLLTLAAGLSGCGGSSQATGPAPSKFEGIPATGLKAPDFGLRDQHGRLIHLSAERGRFVIVTFLYVHCRDVCPVIAGQLNEALQELGPERSQVRVLAVSVDPKGDTPIAVRHFIAVHRLLPQFLYLTGTERTLKPIWADYHIASTPTGPLVVSHTALELLLDRGGTPRVVYDSHVTAAAVIHDLRVLGLHGVG
jgi:protein SCO1/2